MSKRAPSYYIRSFGMRNGSRGVKRGRPGNEAIVKGFNPYQNGVNLFIKG